MFILEAFGKLGKLDKKGKFASSASISENSIIDTIGLQAMGLNLLQWSENFWVELATDQKPSHDMSNFSIARFYTTQAYSKL